MTNTPGQRLRKGRKRLRKSQKEVALEIHKAESTYKSWEQDRAKPRSWTDLIAVCSACGLSVQEYVTGDNRPAKLPELQQRIVSAVSKHSPENQRAILQFLETLKA